MDVLVLICTFWGCIGISAFSNLSFLFLHSVCLTNFVSHSPPSGLCFFPLMVTHQWRWGLRAPVPPTIDGCHPLLLIGDRQWSGFPLPLTVALSFFAFNIMCFGASFSPVRCPQRKSEAAFFVGRRREPPIGSERDAKCVGAGHRSKTGKLDREGGPRRPKPL